MVKIQMTTSTPRFERRAPVSVPDQSPIAADLLRGAREIAIFLLGPDSKEITGRSSD
jgi:hypothetical protein